MDDKYNKFLSTFSSFNKEFSPGKRLIDFYSNQFSFHTQNYDVKNHIYDLNNITINTFNDSHFLIVILDASIRNNIATSILHIHSHNRPVTKMIYHVVNITTTKAKLFVIRCGINQAVSIPNIKHIVIITDSLHTAKRIFDSSSHPYQIHSATIPQELRDFFKKDSNNCIKFWNCSSKQKWLSHSLVDKDTRSFNIFPIFPCKLSQDFCQKQNCNSTIM